MSSPNFSVYFDSLLEMNRGVEIGEFSEDVLDNMEKWGYIVLLDDELIITQKGLNVLEFYLKNRDFISTCTQQIQETIALAYSK